MDLIALRAPDFAVLTFVAFAAGLVRGFSGFALSALVMASAVTILPPRELIPICLILEMAASVLMLRGSLVEADRRVALGLALTSAAGTPLGLWLTTRLPPEGSRLLALSVLIGLAALQLARIRLRFLATNAGLYGTGVLAGIVTGVASVGGMVVALYVLAQEAPARIMRASLVLYLFISSILSILWLLGYGLFDGTSVARGLALALPAAIGVSLGQRLFRPRLERYYKPFALCLLIGLAAISLARTLSA
ncbi:MAG: sulfite exporter TauE/SafE family protein [Jannaschia sp.]